MASVISFVSNRSFFFNHHYHRRQPKITATMRRVHPPWVSPALFPTPHGFPIQALVTGGDSDPAEGSLVPPAKPKDIDKSNGNASPGEGYIGLFVQLLGLNGNPLDRKQAVVTLWKYSNGGKDCIDSIMKFPGCVNLVLSLLKSDNPSTCEAAAGLLRNMSSISLYGGIITESGAIEEIYWALHQSFLTIGVKEQCLCTLWNLSIDEKPRIKIAHGDLFPILFKLLDDEEIKVKEASEGVLANLCLSPCNHSIMVETGVVPKLVYLYKSDAEGMVVTRKAVKIA